MTRQVFFILNLAAFHVAFRWYRSWWLQVELKGTTMKVFLTGGTGFIGQALVRTMRGRGWSVHALGRDTQSAPAANWAGRTPAVT